MLFDRCMIWYLVVVDMVCVSVVDSISGVVMFRLIVWVMIVGFCVVSGLIGLMMFVLLNSSMSDVLLMKWCSVLLVS